MADLAAVADGQQPAAPADDDDVVEIVHPDEQSLAAAEAALEEEQADKPTDPAEPPAADKDALPGQQPPAGDKPAAVVTQPVPTVPLPRLAHEVGLRRKAELDLAEEKGRRLALEDMVKSGRISAEHATAVVEGRAANPATPSPQDQLASVRAEQRALAKKQLEMDPEAYETERQRLEDAVFDIRDKMRQPAAPAQTDDLSLQQATATIAGYFPILDRLSQDQLEPFLAVAVGDMKREGRPYNSGNPQSVLDLRTRVAVIADKVYNNGQGSAALVARLRAAHTPPVNGANPPAGGGTGNRSVTPPPAAVTADQRAAKLALQRQQPPLLEPGNEPAGGLDGITPEAIQRMTTEEIAALPPALLERIEKGTHQWH